MLHTEIVLTDEQILAALAVKVIAPGAAALLSSWTEHRHRPKRAPACCVSAAARMPGIAPDRPIGHDTFARRPLHQQDREGAHPGPSTIMIQHTCWSECHIVRSSNSG
jgi:hypothetical protein